MNNLIARLLETAADKTINEDVSIEDQFPDIVATLMRYEKLLKSTTEQVISSHLSGITKSDLIKGKEVYSRDYFLSLAIPYDGIQELCNELIRYCRIFKVEPSDTWISYADGIFDWSRDIDNMKP